MRWLIIALLCLSARAGAQERAFVVLPTQFAGLTICTENNAPLILLDRGMQGDDELIAEVVAHEMIHVRQMIEYNPGGCKAMQHRYQTDAQYRFDTEFDGYCAFAIRDVKLRGQEPEYVAHHLASFMFAFMDEWKPSYQSLLERARACIAKGTL